MWFPQWGWAVFNIILAGLLGLLSSGMAEDSTTPTPVGIEGAERIIERSYRVGPGDVVDVVVYQEEGLGGLFVINDAGDVTLPLIGAIPAQGLSTSELARKIKTDLGKNYLVNPQVTVRVETYSSQPVQVLGSVSNPGIVYLEGPTTLQELLARVGGVATEQSAREIVIKNEWDGASHRISNVGRLLTTGEGNITLRGGDVVYVREGDTIFVNGYVEKPGTIPYQDGLTITQALALAGGTSQAANTREAYILRGDSRIAINLRRIMKGRDSDVPLERGDQLVIEQSVW